MGKKHNKATQQPRTGFKDYEGATIVFSRGAKPEMIKLLRQAIIVAGGPDFPDLVLGNVALAGVREYGVFFCELATESHPNNVITISISKTEVDKVLGAQGYQAMRPIVVRHYRAKHAYKIMVPTSSGQDNEPTEIYYSPLKPEHS